MTLSLILFAVRVALAVGALVVIAALYGIRGWQEARRG